MIKAPSFSLTAVGAARSIGGPPGPAKPLLLIFHGHLGADSAFNINAIVRDQWPTVEQLAIASVVDLHHIPRYMRPAVELTLSAAYRQAAKRIPQNLDPTQYVVILPDWEGEVTAAFEMQERVNDIGLVLITDRWILFDSYTGPDPLAAVVKMVADALNEAPDAAVNSNIPS
ncbi:MAG: hypothetical protein IT328_26690 [Caldilineaceae bacterium]|nr:hypothetical protein [Caldilineaceae bacterium]